MRPKRVIYILVDGLSSTFFNELVNGGKMPCIEEYLINDGTYVRDCLSCFPANTAPANLAHLTGTYTNRHGIPLIKYWRPDLGTYKDFTKSSLSAIEELNDSISDDVKTIYEYFSDRTTAMHLINRGASDVYAGKSKSIFLYLYAKIFGWNQLHRLAIKTVLKRLASKNPSKVIAVYLPGPDAISHKLGPASSEYRDNVKNLDANIRLLIEGGEGVQGLKGLNILKDTLVIFSSDHGEVEVKGICSLEDQLEELGIGFIAGKSRPEKIRKTSVLMALSGGIAFLNFRNPRNGLFELNASDLKKYPLNGHSTDILKWLRSLKGVNNVYLREASSTYRILGKEGSSRIFRKEEGEKAYYRYQILEGKDPLGYDENETTARMIEKGFFPAREWQSATRFSKNLDIIDQIPRVYDCKDMKSTIIVTSLRNWSFKSHKGEHDNETNEIRRVPLIFSDMKIAAERVDPIRTVDVLPTVLDLLNVAYNKQAIDGVSLVQG